MKKLSSAELFRIPSNDFYMFIQGEDFYSSGVFSVRKEFVAPGSNFATKGIGFDEDGMSYELNSEKDKKSAVYHYNNLTFDDLVEEAKKEETVIYKVQLSGFTRQGVLYGSYIRGFVSVPAKIMEFLIKHISNKETLYTNGKTVFVMRENRVVAMIETCDEPELKPNEKEIIIQLSNTCEGM